MTGKKLLTLGVAAATAVTLGATAIVGGGAAGASERAGVPTIVAHVGGGKIVLSSGNTLHAGRINFKVVTGKGGHSLQIARLHHGYSLQQFGSDIGQAFGGDTAAIGRVDDKVTWRGGAETHPQRPGMFSVTLRKGQFVFLDQNSRALAMVRVVGTASRRPGIAHSSKITAFTYGFDSAPESIPASGTTYFFNQADQPHFLEIQHVKPGVTPRMVKRALSPTAHGNPSWILKGSTSTGVISPTFGQMFSYDLPPGKYLIACFWPDRMTGMPHAFMGMWKLINLV